MDIKMKNYEIKTSFVSPEELKDSANKTSINFSDFYFNIHGKLFVIVHFLYMS